MRWHIAIIVGIFACKIPTAQVKTLTPPFDKLQNKYYSYVVGFSESFFEITVDYEQDLTQALNQHKFTPEQHEQLLKMQHHVRSLIAYAVYSRCFKVPRNRPSDPYLRVVFMERDWRDRYDYNYYLRSTKDYEYQLSVDDKKLCAIFLQQLKELALEQIDLSKPNKKFFQQVMASKVKSLNVEESQVAQQKFFREALAPKIMEITTHSMAHANILFPFHRYDYSKACAKKRDYYFETEAGDRIYRYHQAVRAKIDCNVLQKLPRVAIKKHRKVNCASPTKKKFNLPETQQTFANIEALSIAVNATIQSMNTARAELDELVKQRELDKIKSAQAGKEKYYAPHTDKKAWILPFMKVLNTTKIERNPPIIKAIDAYHCHLNETNKRGILPVIFAKTTQQEIGSVHLNHMGRFFGFGKVQYKPLKLPSVSTLKKAVIELKQELTANWVAMEAARVNTKKIAAKKIYATILNNEFATAQLLLQNPVHAVVVASLLLKFQHQPATPKWLRTFKNFALAADLAFIPIALLGGFVTGGVGLVPILLMANAVNFLWIGGAAAEHIMARNRYRMVERALLTGNSAQIERGMQVLRAMHEKRRDLITSGVVGAPLTLGNLTLIARGLDNLATVPIDVVAAFSADIETISMPNEATSDADLHNER